MAHYVWDIKTKGLQRAVLSEPCINCGNPESMEVVVGQNYLTIFLVPMLPLGKSTWCTCKNCKKDLVLKNLPASYGATYKQLRKKAKTPWWAWLGLGFLVFMAILGAIFMTADKKRNARMLESLKKGDVMGVELPDEKYVLYRVSDIRADSVFYRVSKRTENELYLLDDLKQEGDEAYGAGTQFILKSKLVEMNKEGRLKEISRKVIK